MVLSELRTLQTSFLDYDLDNFDGEEPTSVQQNAQINRALRTIGKELFIVDPKVGFSPKYNVDIYSLDKIGTVTKRVVRPFYVTINGNKLWNADETDYGMWGFQRFVQDFPTWESASTGTTSKAVIYGSRGLILHLRPSVEIEASTSNFIAGQVVPNDLVHDNDDPSDQGVPREIHEAIAYLAAVYAAMPNVTEQEGWARLQAFNKAWMEDVKIVRNENHRAWHTPDMKGTDWPDFIHL